MYSTIDVPSIAGKLEQLQWLIDVTLQLLSCKKTTNQQTSSEPAPARNQRLVRFGQKGGSLARVCGQVLAKANLFL